MRIRQRGDELIETICNRQGDTGAAANELASEMWQGYPVDNLRRLLRSAEPLTVRAGAWIASELGELATPLLPDISGLLAHPESYVRFYALDVVLVNASPAHGELIAMAIALVHDTDKGVRCQCIHFLSKATSDQLRASVRHLREHALAANVKWLRESGNISNTNDIMRRISADDPVARRFAAAAAARLADQTLAPLEHAAASPEEDVSSFAAGELRVQKIRRRE